MGQYTIENSRQKGKIEALLELVKKQNQEIKALKEELAKRQESPKQAKRVESDNDEDDDEQFYR